MPSPRINQAYENFTHFLTLTVIEWIDIFTKKKYCDAVIECLVFCQKNKGLLLYDYVIMSNHLHLIVRADEGHKLSDIISSFKKYTTGTIVKMLHNDNRRYIVNLLKNSFRRNKENVMQIWQRENYPEVMLSQKFLDEKITYIWNNPPKRGLVAKPEEWLYSSARNRTMDDNSIIHLADYVN